MGSNVIKYGPATLAALIRELDEPITNPITNPASIEHGLVMDADEEHRPVHVDAGPSRPARSSRGLHAGDYTVGDALGLRRSDEPDTFAGPIIARSMRTLARNLRDAAGCALAFDLGERLGAWHFNQMDKRPAPWDSNRTGQPAPGWER